MSPFIVPSLKKIVGANLEKIDKVDFRDIHTHRQTDRQTYYSDLIGPSLAGVQNMIWRNKQEGHKTNADTKIHTNC